MKLALFRSTRSPIRENKIPGNVDFEICAFTVHMKDRSHYSGSPRLNSGFTLKRFPLKIVLLHFLKFYFIIFFWGGGHNKSTKCIQNVIFQDSGSFQSGLIHVHKGLDSLYWHESAYEESENPNLSKYMYVKTRHS